jgi:hypothetical protein
MYARSRAYRRQSLAMNNIESGALARPISDQQPVESAKDGYSYPVRFMGRPPSRIATHLRLRHIFALAFGRLTAGAAMIAFEEIITRATS